MVIMESYDKYYITKLLIVLNEIFGNCYQTICHQTI